MKTLHHVLVCTALAIIFSSTLVSSTDTDEGSDIWDVTSSRVVDAAAAPKVGSVVFVQSKDGSKWTPIDNDFFSNLTGNQYNDNMRGCHINSNTMVSMNDLGNDLGTLVSRELKASKKSKKDDGYYYGGGYEKSSKKSKKDDGYYYGGGYEKSSKKSKKDDGYYGGPGYGPGYYGGPGYGPGYGYGYGPGYGPGPGYGYGPGPGYGPGYYGGPGFYGGGYEKSSKKSKKDDGYYYGGYYEKSSKKSKKDGRRKLHSLRRHLNSQEPEKNNKSIPMKKDLSVIGIVRIPKTGSTTLLSFLDFASDIFSWPLHLSGSLVDKIKKPSTCVFGHAPTTVHLGTNYANAHIAGRTTALWNSCPHMPYASLLEHWSDSLDQWKVPETAILGNDASQGSFTFAFEAFSMVRDPFDRLVSFFLYLAKFTDSDQFFKGTVSSAQYERIKAGDLHGWMELLHEEGGGCFGRFQVIYQYKYFHEDLNTAIALIQTNEQDNSSPKIFTTVHECFEPSLRLFAETFEGLDPAAVDEFMKTPEYHSNANKKMYDSILGQNLKLLREKAKVWFEDDFIFYNVAVEQFKKHLAASDVNYSFSEGCIL